MQLDAPRLLLACALLLAPAATAEEPSAASGRSEVIYGRKDGTALTMDVFRPTEAKPNGLGLVYVVSGGWFSGHAAISTPFIEPFTARGYTVFAVVHGSQPKYAIPDILKDLHRAVRYIRTNAKDYAIDPERIGIYGGSAGGHLSLMQGTAGDAGDPKAADPVDRASSRVRAVACFFPPTDFLNYGKEGEDAIGRGVLANFAPAFAFQTFDPGKKTFVPVTDPALVLDLGKTISPINHVSKDDPPSLIVHGDADTLVPIQQAERIVAKLGEAGVEAKLVRKPGAPHGWPNIVKDLTLFADWFDAHLPSTADRRKP